MSLPEQLGRLRRINRIGAGGFATVWLYHDDELRSPVAVKALAENWAQRDDVRDRFLEEARILRAADSDHVVRVYDIGEADGTPYFVMSYADRGSLADHLAPGLPLPPPMVVDLVSQAAQGLDVLHRHGVVHRDIKPQNLLLRAAPDGRARVMVADLGVAKAMLHASGLTQIVGTPAYMAPEQATGGDIDQRADVHALGAVAYQMFTGRRVREGMESVAQGQPPIPPSQHTPLPPGVDAVLLRALDPDPAGRWAQVVDFTDALQVSVLGPGQPVPVPGRSASSGPEPGSAPPQFPTGFGPDRSQLGQSRTTPAGHTPTSQTPPGHTPQPGSPQFVTPSQAGRTPQPDNTGDPSSDGGRPNLRPGRVLLIALLAIVVAFLLSFVLVSLFTR
ncbi:serine/threonine-protein kinase [Microlunatus soli]|uniref:non-specific serine/threonine protein kinase n=1 Tax=Microlunatus soli TaxID=630515 RepID=A0A1H1T6C8_9ACTN|nr:serine/threonine-protein kinase [Microlunatus soli]SDS55189.1 Serine/threonine protein kinase [Microlunatus soli]